MAPGALWARSDSARVCLLTGPVSPPKLGQPVVTDAEMVSTSSRSTVRRTSSTTCGSVSQNRANRPLVDGDPVRRRPPGVLGGPAGRGAP